MEFQEKNEGGILTIRPESDRIEATTAEDFRIHLLERVDGGNRTIILDLELIEFVDSSGLGAMIAALKMMQGRGEILLCRVRNTVLSVLDLSQVTRIFPIFKTEAEARASRLNRVR